VSLGYTTSNRRVDGQTRNLGVKVCSLVTANQTEVTTIAQVQPVLVTFTVPAIHLGTIKSTHGRRKLPVTATPQDASAQPSVGALTFVDKRGRHDDRHHQAQGARFDNPDRRLWPGQSPVSRCG